MLIHRGFKFRIYPTRQQAGQIAKQFGCCRFVYNYFLDLIKKTYDEQDKSLSFFDCNKLLTQLKQEEDKEWLQEVSADSLGQSLRDLDRAYQNFFARRADYPKFKKKSAKQSFSYPAVRLRGDKIRLPKIGLVKIKLHRDISNFKLKSMTVTRTASGKYFVSLLGEREIEEPIPQLSKVNSIGLDYSSTNFYVDSNGAAADYPKFYHLSQVLLTRQQRRLSKMRRGSNNYEKQRIKVAKIHEKIANQRHNYLHTLSRKLTNSYDYICIEDLDLAEIVESQGNVKLGKSTTDNSFGNFVQMLYYKMQEQGKKLIKVGKYFPSSQLCSCCGYRNQSLTLADRQWNCPHCGTFHHRDINAARNILTEGLKVI